MASRVCLRVPCDIDAQKKAISYKTTRLMCRYLSNKMQAVHL